MCQVSCHSVTILTRQCYSQTCKRCLMMIRMESMIWAIKLKKFLLSLAEIKTGEENCILHSEHRETSVGNMSEWLCHAQSSVLLLISHPHCLIFLSNLRHADTEDRNDQSLHVTPTLPPCRYKECQLLVSRVKVCCDTWHVTPGDGEAVFCHNAAAS